MEQYPLEQFPAQELDDALKVVRTLLPWPRECLACYVLRMLEHGCNGLKWSKAYRDLRAPRATALERKFPELGGTCDCEVMANVFRPNAELWEHNEAGEIDEANIPHCLAVRLGSIQPCGLWLMRGGIQWGGGVYRGARKVS